MLEEVPSTPAASAAAAEPAETADAPAADAPAAAEAPPRRRVEIENRGGGGYWYWLGRLYGFAALVVVALVVVTGVVIFARFSAAAPPTPDLRAYARVAPTVTRVFAGDGTLLGEFAEEWREVVPYDQLPETLVHAFLAAEDHRFFQHGGLDTKGIVRALWRNVTSGEFAQGGSTITQQVAKQFLGNEKTLARKATEAIVARRLEAAYDKREILAVYMNHIFLGSGAYGVQAAARRYFSRPVGELDVGQMALIAGLARTPSYDSPLASPERARKRRDQVLDKMARYGYLSADEATRWKAAPLELAPHEDPFLSTSPYFAEHVRRALKKQYGEDALGKAGLRVETTVQPWIDGVAAENVDFSARKQDRRQGWRGPEAHLVDDAAKKVFLERAARKYGDEPLIAGRRYLGLVEQVKDAGAEVRVGTRVYRLPLARMDWAAKWSTSNDVNDQKIASAKEALRPGDVVWVVPARRQLGKFSDWTLDDKQNAHWLPAGENKAAADEVALAQTPHPQAALFTFDHATGYVLAMVGGSDFARSELNRVTQSCRQPGSTYKPIYYSAALDIGYGFDTSLNDIPTAEVDPITGEVWVPENLHGTMDYKVTLEYALVYSKNVPSVDIFKKVGAKNVEAWARRLGFTSPIIADRALALGASCTYMHELGRAFAIFARHGRGLDLVFVRRVIDRDGRVVEDHTVAHDPMLAPGDRLDRVAATAGVLPPQVIPERTAWLTSKLLRAMVRDGYNANLRQTGVLSAGKTGTSSKTMDLWFVAYTSRWLTVAWLGDDLRERQLGRDDAAYMTAVPMWARYMYAATEGQKLGEIPYETPKGLRPEDRGDNRDAVPPDEVGEDGTVKTPVDAEGNPIKRPKGLHDGKPG